MSDLNGKVVIVTGGAGLIGKAFVRAVVEQGGTAVIADVNAETGEQVAADLRAATQTQRVEFVQLDITNKASVQGMVNAVVQKHQRIDALVNNAYPRGPNYGRKFEDVEFEDFCQSLTLHLGGYFLVSKEVARVMTQQQSGVIIFISSIYGFMAPRFELYEGTDFTSPVEYSAIKGGLLGLTKYMASYLGPHGIRVNALSPGGVYNNQAPSFVKQYSQKVVAGKRMAAPDDLTGALTFLISDASAYVTGQNMVVDGGWSI